MDYQDLFGLRVLTGADPLNGVLCFELDGKQYQATEDESDGYRSYLESVIELLGPCQNRFAAEPVNVVEGAEGYTGFEGFSAISVRTGKPVLVVGTEYSDDYYPSCILSFLPQNLGANVEGEDEYVCAPM